MPVTGTGTSLRLHLCPRQEKKGGKGRGGGLHCRVQESTSSLTWVGSRLSVLRYNIMEFGMSSVIKPKRKYARISNEGNWAQICTVCQKLKGSYVMILEF